MRYLLKDISSSNTEPVVRTEPDKTVIARNNPKNGRLTYPNAKLAMTNPRPANSSTGANISNRMK